MDRGYDDAEAARAALECDRLGGGVEAALGRLLDLFVDAIGASAAGVEALEQAGRGLVPVMRTGGAGAEPAAVAVAALERADQDGWRWGGAGGADVAMLATWDGHARGVLWASGVDARMPGAPPPALVGLATRAGGLLEYRRVLGELEKAVVSGVAAEERLLGRIGLDIHDGPTQQMSVALLEVQLLQAELEDARADGIEYPDVLDPGLSRIYETLGGALHELRELISTLRPAHFEARSLEAILREAVAAFEARTDIEVTVSAEGDTDGEGISLTQRITFYRILQEALANAHRHGRARHAWVRLSAVDGATILEVADDGVGFDPIAVREGRNEGLRVQIGLAGMRDRARLVGGTCQIESSPGAGTTVTVRIPRWHALSTTG